jgi:hypothetical protein
MKRFAVGVLAGLLAASATFAADDSRDGGGRAASGMAAEPAKPSRVPLPAVHINKDKAEQCVEPTEVMRRDHMKFILHQRDETMHRGIRTSKHSLKNCVDCHADPVTGSVLGKDGFCATCHQYAAVTIDCFSCHTDKAEKRTAGGGSDSLERLVRLSAPTATEAKP